MELAEELWKVSLAKSGISSFNCPGHTGMGYIAFISLRTIHKLLIYYNNMNEFLYRFNTVTITSFRFLGKPLKIFDHQSEPNKFFETKWRYSN